MYRRGGVGQVAGARVLDALRRFKYGRLVAELAVDVSASVRKVTRDIAALQDAGMAERAPGHVCGLAGPQALNSSR